MNDLDWYYQEAKDYTQSIGGQAASAVEEVYGDATQAGGYVLETLGNIVKAPGKLLESVGKGVEEAGTGFGKGLEGAGTGAGVAAGAATWLLLLGAGGLLYVVIKK
jgi:hypothetical protein